MNGYKLMVNEINKIKIVFFSGTGCTAMVVDEFKKSFEAKGKVVLIQELNRKNLYDNSNEDLLLVIFAVHACNAPEPVYDYINSIAPRNGIKAAVISVSGGGEITPNTACRLHTINRLESKGFKVNYENMLVMPSNWIVPTINGLAVRLLQILPSRVEKMTNDLLIGTYRRTNPNLINRFLSNLGELEKYGAKTFGRKIKVNEKCTSCGWCENACPRNNITLINGTPTFDGSCILCLKCIYGCPSNALSPGVGKFVVIKNGFNINSINTRVKNESLDSIENLAKGYLWKGIKEYLEENDF